MRPAHVVSRLLASPAGSVRVVRRRWHRHVEPLIFGVSGGIASRLTTYQPRAVPVPKAATLLDSRAISALAPLTRDIEKVYPAMRAIIRGHAGIRQWEYGMMLHGLPLLRGKRVLDIGSGPSFLPLYLARRVGAQVTVLDLPTPYTVEAEMLARRLARAGVTLELGDMRSMPFAEGSFDVVSSISVIEHLSHSRDHRSFIRLEEFIQETQRTLREMYRVLRPGGWLYLTSEAYLPGHVDSDAWARKLLADRPYGAYPLDRLEAIFVQPLAAQGAEFPYPVDYRADLLRGSARHSSYRNRYMTAFCLFARKPAGAAASK